MTDTTKNDNWCLDFFNDDFAHYYLKRHDEDALTKTITFLKSALQIKNDDVIFDQCCGIGSISHAFFKYHNVHSIGVDLIPSYIQKCTENNVDKQSSFHMGDAFTFTPEQPCDAAINWWTSFGFSSDDAENQTMIQRAFDSLKSGKFFALDYMNAPQRLALFKDTDILTHKDSDHEDQSVWESTLSDDKKTLIKKWVYTDKNGKRIEKSGGGAKLYTQDELTHMFTECGFINITFYGDMDFNPLTNSSRKCITIAQRP